MVVSQRWGSRILNTRFGSIVIERLPQNVGFLDHQNCSKSKLDMKSFSRVRHRHQHHHRVSYILNFSLLLASFSVPLPLWVDKDLSSLISHISNSNILYNQSQRRREEVEDRSTSTKASHHIDVHKKRKRNQEAVLVSLCVVFLASFKYLSHAI